MDELIKVDQELIRELRNKGQVYEAYQLHQTYLKNKKQNKEQLRKEIKKQNWKVNKCKSSTKK